MSRLSEDYGAVLSQLKADCKTAFEIPDGNVVTFPQSRVAAAELIVIDRGDEGLSFEHDTPVGQTLRLSFKVTAFKRKAEGIDVDSEKVRLLHAFHDLFTVAHYADQGSGQPFRGAWRSYVTSALREGDDPKNDWYTVDVDCVCWIAVARGDFSG